MEKRSFQESAMASIDLNPILAKLCHPTRGLGWDIKRARHAVEQYRRWLWLHTVANDAPLSPTPDVDQVWHAHILDTRKYTADCESMFGCLLHHNPYAGWENLSAEQEHQENFLQTCSLFQQYFGTRFGAQDDIGLCMSGYCDADISQSRPQIWRPTAETIDAMATHH